MESNLEMTLYTLRFNLRSLSRLKWFYIYIGLLAKYWRE